MSDRTPNERDNGTEPPSDPFSLAEHDSSAPFEISEADAEFLETFQQPGQPAPLDVSYTRTGKAIVKTGSHVGVLTLPSGVQIEVTPKQTVTRLLWALRYAFDTPVEPSDTETTFAGATSFFDVIAVLFQTELESVLRQGLHREYVRIRAVREQIRGRLDVQRQLQRPTAVVTDFAVEHDEFTQDNLLNQTILAALRPLTRLVRDDALAARLRQQELRLRKTVSPTRVTIEEVERIELTRLNEHYEALLGLAELILAREFFEDIRAGDRRSLSLFVNMNTVFERMVERAFRAVARTTSTLSVSRQASIPTIITGPHAVSMRPDVLLTDEEGTPVAVVDAKWKTSTASSGDIYQLTSYILALEAPGMLMYPQRNAPREATSTVHDQYTLRSVELATNADVETYAAYADAIEMSARKCLEEAGAL